LVTGIACPETLSAVLNRQYCAVGIAWQSWYEPSEGWERLRPPDAIDIADVTLHTSYGAEAEDDVARREEDRRRERESM
jgi:hypothetical protein